MTADVVMVTGVLGGIGTAIKIALEERGFRVIGLDLAGDEDENHIVFDLATLVDEKVHGELVGEVELRLKSDRLVAVVNNAATQRLGYFEQLKPGDLMDSLAVNAIAPALLVKLLLGELSKTKGQVINVGSIHAEQTKPNFFSYSTSKSALSGVTRAMAVELGDRVRVNMVAPAAIETPMLRMGLTDAQMKSLRQYHPTRSIGETSDVGKLIAAMVSEQIAFLNGAIIELDGGISRRLHDVL